MLSERQLDKIQEKADGSSFHKNAFNCSKCPKEGCPAYWKFSWNLFNKETQTHIEKELKGCGFVLQPILLADIMMNSYHNLDALDQVKNKVFSDTETMKLSMLGLLRIAKNQTNQDQLQQMGREQQLILEEKSS